MGSMFSSPKAPTPMDVNKVQADANKQNINNAYTNKAFNQQNQTDQYGNQLNYSQTGTDAQGNPIFSTKQTMGADAQKFAGGLSGLGQQYLDTAGKGIPDSSAAFGQAYDLASKNLEPRYAQQQAALRTRLANMGISDLGTEAGARADANLGLQQNEARNDLVSKLQGQMFDQSLRGRQQQLSELAPGMQYGAQTLNPNFVNNSNVNVGNVDVAGLNSTAFNQQNEIYKQKVAQQNAMLGGLAGIGGSLLMAPMTGGTSLGGMLGKQMLGGLGGMGGGGGGGQTMTNSPPAGYYGNNFPYGGTF